jgi:ribosomal-protein-alanine N-acetyltransferase
MIVPLSLNHIDEIAVIEKESFSDPWSKESFLDFLINPFAICFAAIDVIDADGTSQENVIGFIIMYHVFTEGQILNIAVKNTHRGKKIATEMFESVLEYARKMNIESLTLEVRQSNIPAIGLYKKFGFVESGIRKNYYKRPAEDAILMTLNLLSQI